MPVGVSVDVLVLGWNEGIAARTGLPLPAAAGQSPRALFEFQLLHSNFFYHYY
jgi:hypothetical protein